MKNRYLTPELLNEKLNIIDVITASGEESSGSSSSATSSLPVQNPVDVDNTIRDFNDFT